MTNRKKQKNRHDDLHTKHVRRVQAVMKAVGVQEEYRRLKPGERDHILRYQSAAPKVVLAAGVEQGPRVRQVISDLEESLSCGTVELAGIGRSIPLKDFFRVARPLASLFRHPRIRSTGHTRLDALAEAYYGSEPLIEDTFEDAISTLLNTMYSVLIFHSHIDENLYWLQLPQDPETFPGSWTFHLHYEPPQIDREDRESAPQTLYRSGGAAVGEFQWLSWTGDQLGLSDGDQELPVYVGKHALRQFRERIPVEYFGGEVEQFMFDSLQEPVFSEGHSDTKLVEFRLPPGKLGYFVVDIDGQQVILRTFLFLTMNNTPEGQMLFQKLQLRRTDKEYLELDKLSTFLMSDIKLDPDLRQAFDQCGCGHLLTMGSEEFVHPSMMDRGGELRKYLGSRLERLLTNADAERYRM